VAAITIRIAHFNANTIITAVIIPIIAVLMIPIAIISAIIVIAATCTAGCQKRDTGGWQNHKSFTHYHILSLMVAQTRTITENNEPIAARWRHLTFVYRALAGDKIWRLRLTWRLVAGAAAHLIFPSVTNHELAIIGNNAVRNVAGV
jgi:hypothetical protein